MNVELERGHGDFNHLGDVIWQRPIEEGYLVGVHITEHLCNEKVWQEGVMSILTS
jgi:hypothetical protein